MKHAVALSEPSPCVGVLNHTQANTLTYDECSGSNYVPEMGA